MEIGSLALKQMRTAVIRGAPATGCGDNVHNYTFEC